MNDEIFVTKAVLPPLKEYIEEIREIWDSSWLTNMGKKHELLEESLREYLKVEKLSLMCNGHMSLELCLQAFNLTGEVITTPFTFASTTHAIVRNRLRPVFCDIDPESFTIDPEQIEDLITEKTSAIVPVHVYGNTCDVERIQEIAFRHNLKVIYDAAHAFGVEVDGRGIGSFGDASVFSFHATKVYHTIEGGAVSFSDAGIGTTLYHLKNFGIMGPENVEGIGANAKMNEFQAAMGLCNLRHIEENIQRRKLLWELYQEQLADIKGLRLPAAAGTKVKSNYAYFPVIVDEKQFGRNRDQAAEYLAQRGIMVRKYFYPLTSAFSCYEGKLDHGYTPEAEKISRSVITLPLYPQLEPENVIRICTELRRLGGPQKG